MTQLLSSKDRPRTGLSPRLPSRQVAHAEASEGQGSQGADPMGRRLNGSLILNEARGTNATLMEEKLRSL